MVGWLLLMVAGQTVHDAIMMHLVRACEAQRSNGELNEIRHVVRTELAWAKFRVVPRTPVRCIQ